MTRSPECVPPGADISGLAFARAHDFVLGGAAEEAIVVGKAGVSALSAKIDIVEPGREI